MKKELQLGLSISTSPNKWVLFGGKDSTSQALRRKLELYGLDVKMILHDDNNVSGDHVENLIEEVLSPPICGVIYMWGTGMIDTTNVCQPFLYICRYLSTTVVNLKVMVVTNGCMKVGSMDYCQRNPAMSPILGMIQVLANENEYLQCKALDLDFSGGAVDEIFSELHCWNLDTQIAYRNNKKYTPRLQQVTVQKNPLAIPTTPNIRLILPYSNLNSDFCFTPFQSIHLTEGQVEAEIRAYGLNFLDVLVARKPDPIFDSFNTLGMDITGTVTALGPGCQERKIGDRVVVFRRGGESVPSRISVLEKLTIPIPTDMTFSDAATIPIGSLTVFYALHHIAQAKKEDVLLIHTASGGVGLLGIQIARKIGCIIIATAGSVRKRNYLKSLGVNLVFDSRSLAFEHGIREALGGNLVTIALNSLTGEGFKEATLSVCKTGATFIEMSKMNIWSKKDLQELRPDVSYHVIDLTTLPGNEVKILIEELWSNMQKGIEDSERLTPLPYTSFELRYIKNALEYVERAKHIGKVILTMPFFDKLTTKLQYILFNKEATYLITGGLGGIGLEVAKWMVSFGAQNLLLVCRSPPNARTLRAIETMEQSGVSITHKQKDVGNLHEVNGLFNEFCAENGLYPIRGIMHAAGVLEDGPLEKQTWQSFENVFRPKIRGGWNLHEVSSSMKFPLEHFVVFSSMASVLGSYGQSNYVAANFYFDSLIHYRRSLGLPGLTINWGQWGQVGLAADIAHRAFKPFTVCQGISASQVSIASI